MNTLKLIQGGKSSSKATSSHTHSPRTAGELDRRRSPNHAHTHTPSHAHEEKDAPTPNEMELAHLMDQLPDTFFEEVDIEDDIPWSFEVPGVTVIGRGDGPQLDVLDAHYFRETPFDDMSPQGAVHLLGFAHQMTMLTRQEAARTIQAALKKADVYTERHHRLLSPLIQHHDPSLETARAEIWYMRWADALHA